MGAGWAGWVLQLLLRLGRPWAARTGAGGWVGLEIDGLGEFNTSNDKQVSIYFFLEGLGLGFKV